MRSGLMKTIFLEVLQYIMKLQWININTGEYQSVPITADGPDPSPWDPSNRTWLELPWQSLPFSS